MLNIIDAEYYKQDDKAECHYAECYKQDHKAVSHYDGFHYAECHDAEYRPLQPFIPVPGLFIFLCFCFSKRAMFYLNRFRTGVPFVQQKLIEQVKMIFQQDRPVKNSLT
jgi:hypothetical protein